MLNAECLSMPSSETSPSSETRRFEAIPFKDAVAARLSFVRVSSRLTPALSSTLPALLADSPDPHSSLLLFERLATDGSAETLRLL